MSYQSMPRTNWAIDRENNVRASYACVAPHGHTFDDVLSPMYFSQFRPQQKQRIGDKGVRVGDLIEVRAEDMSWYATLMVRAVPDGMSTVQTAIIDYKEFSIEAEEQSAFSWEYRGLNEKWVLMHKGKVIETRIDSADACRLRADWHDREQAAGRARAEVKSRRPRKPASEKVGAE